MQINASSNHSLININLPEDERIVAIDVTSSVKPDNYVSSLDLFTYRPSNGGTSKHYGPYGSRNKYVPGANNTDRVIGIISGFYGRSGTIIDALGVYT